MGTLLRKTTWWLPVGFAFTEIIASFHRCVGSSMSETLNPSGSRSADVVIVDRLSFRLYHYTRGDVVVFTSPTDPKKQLIKRVIGLEGDWVSIPGSLRIERIPSGHCWLEGDNSIHSDDSRTSFGPVPLALLQGRVMAVVWPPSRVSRVENKIPKGRVLASGQTYKDHSVTSGTGDRWWNRIID